MKIITLNNVSFQLDLTSTLFFSVEESKRIEEFYEEKMFCHHCDDSLGQFIWTIKKDISDLCQVHFIFEVF